MTPSSASVVSGSLESQRLQLRLQLQLPTVIIDSNGSRQAGRQAGLWVVVGAGYREDGFWLWILDSGCTGVVLSSSLSPTSLIVGRT